MTKLLNKPLRVFTIYALIILIISIPAYVFVVDYIWTHELDENNAQRLQHIKQRIASKKFTPDDIEQINQLWGKLQPDVTLSRTEGKGPFRDSIYEARRPNEYASDDEEERLRGLKSYVEINGVSYGLTIETNVEETDETFLAITAITLVFFIILILGFVLLNRNISAQLWDPFYRTLRALQNFELSKEQKFNLPNSNIQEFQELNESLKKMVNNSVASYQQQKSFTENASHELQTPLALLKSKLDILRQQIGVSPEISRILDGIEAPLSRLTRINKNLLLLAKVENQQFSEKQHIDATAYIHSALDLLNDYILEKNLHLTNKSQGPLWITANPFLLETLIHNLLSNAIRHTDKGGEIIISRREKTLMIMNSGSKGLDQKFMFERFSTATDLKVSSGLGLAIIKEIANKYNWKVGYHFEKNFHIFSITV